MVTLDSRQGLSTLSLQRMDSGVQMSISIEEAAESDRKTIRSLAWTMAGFGLLTVVLIVAALAIT